MPGVARGRSGHGCPIPLEMVCLRVTRSSRAGDGHSPLAEAMPWVAPQPFPRLLLWDSLQLVLSEQGDAERQQPGPAARKGKKVALAVHQQLRPWLKPPQHMASVSLRVTLKSPSLLSRSPACWGKWLNQSTETCCSSASQNNRGFRSPVPRAKCGLASASLPWFGLW